MVRTLSKMISINRHTSSYTLKIMLISRLRDPLRSEPTSGLGDRKCLSPLGGVEMVRVA